MGTSTSSKAGSKSLELIESRTTAINNSSTIYHRVRAAVGLLHIIVMVGVSLLQCLLVLSVCRLSIVHACVPPGGFVRTLSTAAVPTASVGVPGVVPCEILRRHFTSFHCFE